MNKSFASDITRREFLRRSAARAAGATLGLTLADALQAASGKKIPVGLQLYSLREPCKTDLPGMLAAVAKIGYQGVEFAGYYGRTAKELRKLLDDNGLKACGTHIPYESLLDNELARTIEFNLTLGNKFLIVFAMAGKSKQDWLDKARLFNELTDKVTSQGLWVGYHAHAQDFEKYDGESAWDLFFGHTKAEVIMQLDTGNCCEGGADPVVVLRKYSGRARSIHLKAYGAGPEAAIGEDRINWKEVFAFCEGKAKTEWYVVENENSKDPLNTAQRNFAALKGFGRA